jgi:hypothetical protein
VLVVVTVLAIGGIEHLAESAQSPETTCLPELGSNKSNTSAIATLRLYSGSLKALLRLYSGLLKLLLRLYSGSLKALLRLYSGSLKAL